MMQGGVVGIAVCVAECPCDLFFFYGLMMLLWVEHCYI